MLETVLRTKLYIPISRSPNLVPRPRLIERLNQGLQLGLKLTLVSAPAGFGKTTLTSEWIAGCGRPVAWLSLDGGDNNPARFLTYLVAALQTVEPDIGERVLASLQSPQPPPIESMLTALLNEITAVPDSFVLVLDDYHQIDTQAIDDVLTFVLEHLPPQMHLVITTREDPQFPLARLRVRGQLTELRVADLRFTLSEVADFLTQAMNLNLSEDEIAALEIRTEGWIAGLQMAALSIQGRADTADFIQAFTGSHRFVLDYLVEEVLQRQSDHVRNFLLQTSVLERLSGPLCDAVRFGRFDESLSSSSRTDALRFRQFDESVRFGETPSSSSGIVITGQENSRGLLESLERSNLFVIPLDDVRQWYRYHHLFADVLQACLLQEQPKQVPVLHQRASVWYEQSGLPEDAIRHALAAEDFERAADLIELARPIMDGRFQSALWLAWAKALPDELVRIRPVLSAGYGWALLDSGEMEASEARLQDAERWLDKMADKGEPVGAIIVDQDQFRVLPSSIAVARAYRALAYGDVPGTVTHAQRALDLLPTGEKRWRGAAMSLLGIAQYTSGNVEAAQRSLSDLMGIMLEAGRFPDAIGLAFVLADINMILGRLHEAARVYERLLKIAAGQGEPMLLGTSDLYRGLSELHRERGDLETARQYLLRGEALGEQASLTDWPYRLAVAQARLEEVEGNLDGALDYLNQAERLYVRSPLPNVRPAAALKTRVMIRQGRLAEALNWTQEQNLAVDDDLNFMREFEHITLARVLVAGFKHGHEEVSIHEAMGLLDRLLREAEAGNRFGSVIEILLLQALAHEAQGDMTKALDSLERALALAGPEDYIRTFVDEGSSMARLLQEAASRGIVPEYTQRLLAAFLPAGPKQVALAKTESMLVDPLSQRELEVLQLIAQGLSNREISERLFLSLNTVKGHNRNIFGKLQVQRRTEAVARARELGLL